MTPKISVIIPIYNTEQYLRKCLDSIISQSMKDIEIICVDDCSPDDSYHIVQEYVRKDSRVSLIRHKKNLGQGGARNTAILAARANYIASVDSDDTMQASMLETLWKASGDGEFDVVCCGYNRVDESGKVISNSQFHSGFIDNKNNDINIFTIMNPAIWNKLWKKSLFVDNNIFFPNQLYYQDMATTPLLLSRSNKIMFISDCLYNYLVREGSVTNSYSSKHIVDYFKVYGYLYDSLDKFDLVEHYSEELIWYINDGMRFHSNNILDSTMSKEEIKQYLRHLLMLKIAFLETHNTLRSKNTDELIQLLAHTISINEVVPAFTDILGVKYPVKKSLNSFQKTGARLFGIVFQGFINRKQMKKLKVDPRSFFRDSKNKFTRAIGAMLRVI